MDLIREPAPNRRPGGPQAFQEGILPRIKALDLPRPALACEPPFWARGGHMQALAAQFLGSPLGELPWERHRLALPSGDALALQSMDGSTGVAVHLFHGMSGSTDEPYMRRTAARLHERGHAVLAMNHRGAGAGKGWSRDFYHAGSTGDIAAALAFGRRRFPHHLHVAIAFSMSASILLLLMGRDARKGVPDLAIAVNPPVDLEAGSRRLGIGLNQAYDRYFISSLRTEVQARLGSAPLEAASTTRALDRVFTAGMAGFPSRDAYYAQCSCGPHLRRIRVPTVIISSMDDPLAPAGDLRQQILSPAVQLHVEQSGGHMGYITGNLPDRCWLNYALEHYLDELVASSCEPWY
jgi:predicted alpha/beta-fold hydrolase